jgi:hypothetical protein
MKDIKDDFSELKKLIYSGEGIVIGMTPDEKPFMGYSLTGKPATRARKLGYDVTNKMVHVNSIGEKKLNKEDSDLLTYSAMTFIDNRGIIVASNGRQIIQLMSNSFYGTLSPVEILLEAHAKSELDKGVDITSYKNDKPNFTPRISGCIDDAFGALYVVKKSDNGIKSIATPFSYKLRPGRAWMITTYKGGNENPLLSFTGNPIEIGITSMSAEQICQSLYDAIGPKNRNYRISAAVMLLRNKKQVDVARINRSDRKFSEFLETLVS